MPRKEGQKAKLLVLLGLFKQHTDLQHRLTVPQLEAMLTQAGIPCERKSIYTDIDALREMGYDIELVRGRGGGYCLASRQFELPELKLLVDAVQSSRFITRRKSGELIKKLETLASAHEAKQLGRQVFVSGRVKSMNESAYYMVDALYEAIDANRMVHFQYSDWTPEKKKVSRRPEGYSVSPWALAWENNSYYLIAYTDYDTHPGIRHYRVDKMSGVRVLAEVRRGRELYETFDLAAYMQGMFNMFGGTVQRVTLRCENRLAGAMFDRFGTEVIVMPEEDGEHFHFDAPVAVSPQFLGWVCGFGTAVEVLGPAEVCAQMKTLCDGLAEKYR